MAGAKRAVVVGINKYQDDKKIPELHGAENDAREVADRLRDLGDFKIDEDRHLLTGSKATSDNIWRAISDVFWKKNPPSEVTLFFFSGHGFQDSYGNAFIAPWDMVYEEPCVRGIRIQELKQYFLAPNANKQSLLILDCCHSGVAAEPNKGEEEAVGPFLQALPSDSEMAGAQPPTEAGASLPLSTITGAGKFILASSGSDEKSRELECRHAIEDMSKNKHHHGLFTYHLLEGLDGKAPVELGGNVTISTLHKYVAEQMKEHKQHECRYWGFASGDAEALPLVIPSRRDIGQILKDARVALEADTEGNPNPSSLFDAIGQVDSALKKYDQALTGTTMEAEIDGRLRFYRKQIFTWLIKNRMQYTKKYGGTFGELVQVAANMCLKEILKQEELRRQLLMDLCLATLGSGNTLDFYLENAVGYDSGKLKMSQAATR